MYPRGVVHEELRELVVKELPLFFLRELLYLLVFNKSKELSEGACEAWE